MLFYFESIEETTTKVLNASEYLLVNNRTRRKRKWSLRVSYLYDGIIKKNIERFLDFHH